MNTLMPYVPFVLGVAGAAAAMLLSAWGHRASAVTIAIVGLVAGASAAGSLVTSVPMNGVVGSGGAFSLLSLVCLSLGAVALVGSFKTLVSNSTGPRVAILVALASSAAALLATSLDLGMLFLAVEALALCGYGMVVLSDTAQSREAAMKWFIQGSVATAIFIVGIGVLLSRTAGSLSYSAIAQAAQAPGASGPLAIGFVLVLSALAFKAGSFPFHSWMPDTFQTAPPAATAVLASAGKVGPIAAIVWLALAVAGPTADRVLVIAAILSVASIVFGNLAALRQRSFARMLAYSGTAQVGYALAGVALVSGSQQVLFFAVLYGLTSVASFIFVVALREVEPSWDGSIPGLAGLSRRHPALSASLVVIMLSLTGIPLTAGFWGKFLIFGAASVGGYMWLAVIGMLGSVVSFGYYGGVVRAAYMNDETTLAAADTAVQADAPAPIRGFATATTVVLAILIVVVGVLPFVTGLGIFTRLF